MKKLLFWLGIFLILIMLIVGITIYSWTQTPYGNLDYKAALGLQLLYEPPDFENLTVPELRSRYLEEEKSLTDEYKQWIASSFDTTFFGNNREIPVRVYKPSLQEKLPIIVYYHGGGFVFGRLNEYNTMCAKIAQYSASIVVSVDYSLAPEHPYPAAPNDAYHALVEVYRNSKKLGGDSTRIAVMGSSAGGNLATVAAMMARDQKSVPVSYQVLLYPATQSINLETESHLKFSDGKYGQAGVQCLINSNTQGVR